MNNCPYDRVEMTLGAFLQARGHKFVSGYNVGVGCGLVSRIQNLAVSIAWRSGGIWFPESGYIWFLVSRIWRYPESGIWRSGVWRYLVSRIQNLAVSRIQNLVASGIWFLAVWRYLVSRIQNLVSGGVKVWAKKKGSRMWLPFFFCLEC